VWGLKFTVQGSTFTVQDLALGFRVKGSMV